MQNNAYNITTLLLIITFLIMLMAVFILFILFLHRKKQLAYQEKIKEIEANYEKNIMQTQLEIQEQTFQHISREIHDNISLSLTLAKLHLHTLDWNDKEKSIDKVDTSIHLLTNSIAELSDISKSLNADIIIQHGLLKAIEDELQRIRLAGLFAVDYELTGTPVYMDNQKELIIFRIIQESFNNIIKHAEADSARLALHYNTVKLIVTIRDDGMGFDATLAGANRKAGLKNMETRIKTLKGEMHISSQPGKGTVLSFTIPFE
jgi:two-component system, NarL family, sensor kinase